MDVTDLRTGCCGKYLHPSRSAFTAANRMELPHRPEEISAWLAPHARRDHHANDVKGRKPPGHALGLGHSSDADDVMFDVLSLSGRLNVA